MAITFIGPASTTTGSPIVLSHPPTAQVDDLMIVGVNASTVTTITPPAGWTDFAGNPYSGIGHFLRLYYRFWQTGDPASWSWGNPGGNNPGFLITYREVDSTSPFDAGPVSLLDSIADANHFAPNITTTVVDTVLVTVHGMSGSNTQANVAAGQTERVDVVDVRAFLVGDEPRPIAGGTGLRQATTPLEPTSLSVGISTALRPIIPLPEEDGFEIPTEDVGHGVSMIAREAFATPLGVPASGGGGVTGEFRMRAFDTTLGRIVYWTSSTIDTAGVDYTGPGPLTDVVISQRC